MVHGFDPTNKSGNIAQWNPSNLKHSSLHGKDSTKAEVKQSIKSHRHAMPRRIFKIVVLLLSLSISDLYHPKLNYMIP